VKADNHPGPATYAKQDLQVCRDFALLLDEEHAALLSNDIQQLQKLVRRKQQQICLLEDVATRSANAPDAPRNLLTTVVRDCRDRNARNGALLRFRSVFAKQALMLVLGNHTDVSLYAADGGQQLAISGNLLGRA
jgi:flagellar biosynthesis/type III secretory pathway chaperone